MCRRRNLALGSMVWIALGAAPLHGEVAYDTYPFGASPGPDRLVGEAAAGNFQYADWFALSGGDALLESLTVRVRTTVTVGTGTAFVLRFREDSGGLPGAVLESWVVPAGIEAETDITLDSQLNPLLGDGEVYWINVAADSPTGFGGWMVADADTLDWLQADARDVDPAWQMPAPDSQLRGLGFARVEVPEPGPRALGAAAVLGFPLLLALRTRLAPRPSQLLASPDYAGGAVISARASRASSSSGNRPSARACFSEAIAASRWPVSR